MCFSLLKVYYIHAHLSSPYSVPQNYGIISELIVAMLRLNDFKSAVKVSDEAHRLGLRPGDNDLPAQSSMALHVHVNIEKNYLFCGVLIVSSVCYETVFIINYFTQRKDFIAVNSNYRRFLSFVRADSLTMIDPV